MPPSSSSVPESLSFDLSRTSVARMNCSLPAAELPNIFDQLDPAAMTWSIVMEVSGFTSLCWLLP
jgi:hypothetical protein